MLQNLQQRAVDLSSLRDSLEQQLGSVESKLEEALQRLRRVQDGSVSDELSDFNDDASTRTWNTEYTLDGLDDHSVASNNTDISLINDPPALPVDLLSRDTAHGSNVSESISDNPPLILFSSNTEGGVRVDVHGNARLTYTPRRSSGSETGEFIAESSGYGESPVHDLDRLFSETDNGINASRRSASPRINSPVEQRPTTPEPPYSMNNSSDNDTDSIVQDNATSPVLSHYSLHTLSDSDTADAVRDILNLSPPHKSAANDNTSHGTATPKHRSSVTSFSLPGSADEQSEIDDLKGFSSSDAISEEAASDREQQSPTGVQPFYRHDILSDDDNDGFVNNSPSASLMGDRNHSVPDVASPSTSSRNSVVSKLSKRRGFLLSESDSEVSDHSVEVVDKTKNNRSPDHSDNNSTGNESKLTFSESVASSNLEYLVDRLEGDLPPQQSAQISSPRSRKHSGESEQIDVQSLLDHFSEENVGSSSQAEVSKDDSSVSDDQLTKSLDKLTEALEELADEADEMESLLRNGRENRQEVITSAEQNKSPATNSGRNGIRRTEPENDYSDEDTTGTVSDDMDTTDDLAVNNVGLRDRLLSAQESNGISTVNVSSNLNSSDCSIMEIKNAVPSNTRALHLKVGRGIPKSENRPAADTSDSQKQGNNRSRTSRHTAAGMLSPCSSRDQDRYIELLEEQYALKRQNKNLDIERYVSHVRKMMSSQGSEVDQERHNGIDRSANNKSDVRQTVKRKCDQQETMVRGTLPKKAKREVVDRPNRPSRSFTKAMDKARISSQSSARMETVAVDSTTAGRSTPQFLPLDLGSAGSKHKRNNSATGIPASTVSITGTSTASRKTVDKKHPWDSKNLNISLNVAINLDKAARGRDQTAGTSSSLLSSGVQQNSERPLPRSVPSLLKQRERLTQEKVKSEGNHQHRVVKSERLTTNKPVTSSVKTERLSSGVQSKSCASARSTNKATSTVPKPPPATTITHSIHTATRRPRRHAAASTFTREPSSETESDSDQDVNWEPSGNEQSDVSITSSEEEEEVDTEYKLKIPIPTATLLEKYKNCDDSDDSWSPPV